MKRIMLIFMAALMLTGCSLKKSSDTEPPVENDDKAVENVIIEYDASEFRRIDIPLTFEDGSQPVEFEEFSLSDLGIEEREVSELPEECLTGDVTYDSEELESVRKGKKYHLNIIGEKLFFFSDHSISGQVDFDFSLYCYDLSTKELKKLYTYSGNEPPFFIADASVDENGNIYFTDYDSEYDHKIVYKLDVSSGEISEALDTGSDISYIESDRETGQPLAVTYNSESGINEGYILTDGGFKHVEKSEFMGWSTELTEGSEDRYDVVTDSFRLHTGFSSFNVESVTDSRITLSWNSGKLFTFDFDKMELYVTEGRELQSLTPDKNGNFYCNAGPDYSLRMFVPELGTAFRIYDSRARCYSLASYRGQPVFVATDDGRLDIQKLMIIKEGE